MDTLTVILVLLVGVALGALGTYLVMRDPRARGASRTDAGRLDAQGAPAIDPVRLQLERDTERREAQAAQRDAELRSTLAPITHALTQLEQHVERSESARARSDGALRAHLEELGERTRDLDRGTHALTAALRAPTSRGRWGEVQLRRIVEAAGMLEHVDFSEQHSGRGASGEAGQRPDMVVRLSGGRSVVVDAKAPMDAYLDAVEEPDPDRARTRRAAHAKAMRGHADRLGSKAYWAALGDTPEFTVMFVPSDGVLAAALESDPELLEHAFSRDVVVASPATLVALLRTVAHTWRTDSLNRDARQVLDAGRELHHRLGTLAGHLGKVGRSLDSSVAAYNDAVGSLQSRVMVTARRFEDMELTSKKVEDVEQLTRRARSLDEEQIADLARGDAIGRAESTGDAGSRAAG
ncbi:DNA recombination protein RmuC [Brachybacterium sp. MASK1Z-5]|uniref:DNA recombination protein RmuC n=1 Tax=Brachybacterium halotolerans TaxID=2795215 RepID=A0ABS1BAF5_9MICO|nr:DNA recombination protein RmuC [Brachybacterium halotolerans]MBK0331152.1 DNA recombination protein RmuC [Brachybacterium halotolerans]